MSAHPQTSICTADSIQRHFLIKLLTISSSFLQVITTGGVTYKNDPFHRECFVCTHCETPLAGQRFTSRDEKPYCADCFGDLFAKRCTSCTKPITGKFTAIFYSFKFPFVIHQFCFFLFACAFQASVEQNSFHLRIVTGTMIALLAVHVRHHSWDVDSLQTRKMTLSVPIAPKPSLWLPKGKCFFLIHKLQQQQLTQYCYIYSN